MLPPTGTSRNLAHSTLSRRVTSSWHGYRSLPSPSQAGSASFLLLVRHRCHWPAYERKIFAPCGLVWSWSLLAPQLYTWRLSLLSRTFCSPSSTPSLARHTSHEGRSTRFLASPL